MNVLETFENLPTWGKWATGLGALGLVLLIWKPWSKKTTSSGGLQTTTSADLASGYPMSSGGGSYSDGSTYTSGGGGYGYYPSLPSSGGSDTSGGGTGSIDSTGGLPPTAVMPQSKPTAYNGNLYTASNPNQVVQAISKVQNLMTQANSATTQDSPIHQAKVGVASSVGVKVTDSGYAFDQTDKLVKAMSPGATGYTGGYKDTNNPYEQIQIINQTVQTNGWGNLSLNQQNNLHQAKMNAVKALGETVDNNGIVRYSNGTIDTRLSAG